MQQPRLIKRARISAPLGLHLSTISSAAARRKGPEATAAELPLPTSWSAKNISLQSGRCRRVSGRPEKLQRQKPQHSSSERDNGKKDRKKLENMTGACIISALDPPMRTRRVLADGSLVCGGVPAPPALLLQPWRVFSGAADEARSRGGPRRKPMGTLARSRGLT